MKDTHKNGQYTRHYTVMLNHSSWKVHIHTYIIDIFAFQMYFSSGFWFVLKPYLQILYCHSHNARCPVSSSKPTSTSGHWIPGNVKMMCCNSIRFWYCIIVIVFTCSWKIEQLVIWNCCYAMIHIALNLWTKFIIQIGLCISK